MTATSASVCRPAVGATCFGIAGVGTGAFFSLLRLGVELIVVYHLDHVDRGQRVVQLFHLTQECAPADALLIT